MIGVVPMSVSDTELDLIYNSLDHNSTITGSYDVTTPVLIISKLTSHLQRNLVKCS